MRNAPPARASWPSARRWLLASAGSPIVADQRVVLIEGADRANEQTQNALLKALEEPSPRQMFVLIADEPGRLLPTIRSRAQPLRVGPVSKAELRDWLVEHERQAPDRAEEVARLAGGLTGSRHRIRAPPDLLSWREATQRELLDLISKGRPCGSTRFATSSMPPPRWGRRPWTTQTRRMTRRRVSPARPSAPRRCWSSGRGAISLATC